MRRALPAALVATCAIASTGCARGSPVAPSGAGVLHRPQNSTAAEIRAARASDSPLFAIFPARPGREPCVIPAGGMVRPLHGTCQTSVTYPVTFGRDPEAFVRFRESWGSSHSSAWTLIVQWPREKVVATQLHGETSPQMRYAAMYGARAAPRPAHIPVSLLRALRSDQLRIRPAALRAHPAISRKQALGRIEGWGLLGSVRRLWLVLVRPNRDSGAHLLTWRALSRSQPERRPGREL